MTIKGRLTSHMSHIVYTKINTKIICGKRLLQYANHEHDFLVNDLIAGDVVCIKVFLSNVIMY